MQNRSTPRHPAHARSALTLPSLLLVGALATAPASAGETRGTAAPPPPSPASAVEPPSPVAPGPVRTPPLRPIAGRYELRPELGAGVAFNNFGLPNIGSNHMIVGFTLSKNRTEALALAWGLHYLVGDRLTGAHASWEARYRFLNLNPLVVPVVFGGLGVNLGNVEEFKKRGDRAAQLVGGFRGGLALDVMVHERIFPSFQAAFEVGPRFLPSAGLWGAGIFTFGLNFTL